MDLGLRGKSVIVTGGGSNIGRAIVLAFAQEGARIAIAEIDEPQAHKVAQEVARLGTGATALVVKTDVTDYASVENMVNRVLQAYGAIDVLVNNVGWTVDRLFLEKPREEWEKEVKVNLWGVINCCRAVLPHMVQRQRGAVVSISSDAGRMGEYREAVYGACKAGVIALMKALAREVGRYNIRLNAVCPGLTVPRSDEEVGEASMWKQQRAIFTDEVMERAKRNYVLRRLGTAQEVANAVVFLASDAASFITGQTLSVSGGYTMM
ncbi:MAG: SDR family oxidoreductase [Dehalococcoidia bacterium]|nr:SDR family oxidoreductase [Dehalococcoidia bacterium]MDW8119722.1 SDR family NAD(P)-dependent oxidoreductase [Chloroflexota bacterium]